MKKLLLLFSFSLLSLLSMNAIGLNERISILEEKAASGDPEALFHLSTLFERGFDSIPADTIRSARLLRESAEKGYAPAQNYLGFKIYQADPDSAVYWLSKAADAGNMKAVSNLAFILLEPDSTINPSTRLERDSRAAVLLQEAVNAQIPTAMATLGDLYREGRGVEKDTLMAEHLYFEAIRKNLNDAEKKLLSMNASRYQALPPDSALSVGLKAADAGADAVAFMLFSKATEGDIPRAHTLLADCYSSAKGTDYNHARALRHYLLGALGGDPSAQFILAELLEIFPDALQSVGEGDFSVPEEILNSTPQYWYEKASQNGVNTAKEAYQKLRSPQAAIAKVPFFY